MNLLRFWKMLKKYSQQSFYLETHPRLAIIPPDFQLNSQNSITLLSLRSVPKKQHEQSNSKNPSSKQEHLEATLPPFPFPATDMSGARVRRSV